MSNINKLLQRIKECTEKGNYPILNPEDCKLLVEALNREINLRKINLSIKLKMRERIRELESRSDAVKLPMRRSYLNGRRSIGGEPYIALSVVEEALKNAGLKILPQ